MIKRRKHVMWATTRFYGSAKWRDTSPCYLWVNDPISYYTFFLHLSIYCPIQQNKVLMSSFPLPSLNEFVLFFILHLCYFFLSASVYNQGGLTTAHGLHVSCLMILDCLQEHKHFLKCQLNKFWYFLVTCSTKKVIYSKQEQKEQRQKLYIFNSKPQFSRNLLPIKSTNCII